MSGPAAPAPSAPVRADGWTFRCRDSAGNPAELTLINSRVSVILAGPSGTLALDPEPLRAFLVRLARESGMLLGHGKRG